MRKKGGVVAPKTTAKKQAVIVAGHPRRSVESVAEFIGSSLGELMNRKDALVKQLASLEKQIAATRDSVVVAGRKTATTARKAVTPAAGKPAAAKPAAAKATVTKKGNGKRRRPQPPSEPMVSQTTRAAMADVKARTAQQMRTTRRSGNR